jgi:glycosyltransferase involved in cell wall biosynthesis
MSALSNRKIRVLLMIDEATVGGGQQHVLWLARGLDRAAFDVAVACESEGYLVDELRSSGIKHFSLTMTNRPSASAGMRARHCIMGWKAEIVHTHGGAAGVTGRLAAQSVRGCRIVHTYHGHHYLHQGSALKRQMFTRIERTLLRVTDRIICVARADRDTGVAAGIVDPAKTSVILNGIACDRYTTQRTYALAGPVMGTIGRMHEQKGQRFLLDAMPEILRCTPGARLVIHGWGELEESLKAHARELQLGAAVSFAGRTNDPAGVLREMELFVLPSLWEGFPIVLLEAMASGLPIVATAVDGVLEMVSDGRNALLVPPGDPGLLAQAVTRVLHDENLRRRLGENAARDVRERFSVERMVAETEVVYKEVLR